MIVLGKLESILFVSMQNGKESVILDLVIFHIFFLQVLAIDLSSDNSRSDKVLLRKRESHLLKNVFNLVALGERAVCFHMDLLQNVGRVGDIAFFFLQARAAIKYEISRQLKLYKPQRNAELTNVP